ncbi:hypothetical protein [Desulfothermus naphthae]
MKTRAKDKKGDDKKGDRRIMLDCKSSTFNVLHSMFYVSKM